MKHTKLFALIICSLIALTMKSQTMKKILDDNQNVVDSVLVAKFPNSLPLEFHHLHFKWIAKSRLHNNRIDVIFDMDLFNKVKLSADDIVKYRRNVGVYYYRDDIRDATLYKYGVCISDISFNANEDGNYIVVLMKRSHDDIMNNNFSGKVLIADLKDGIVDMYTAMQPD